MGAGASAEWEANRSLLEAEEYERLRRDALNRAQRYALASKTEASVGAKLVALDGAPGTLERQVKLRTLDGSRSDH